MANLVKGDIAAAIGGGLREFAEHHQFGQGRGRTDPPDRAPPADRLDQFRLQKERQALVAANVVMGADIFVAGETDQHGPRHQLERPPAGLAAEAALAHIGNRVAVKLLCKRLVAGDGGAAELRHRDRAVRQQGRPDHEVRLTG